MEFEISKPITIQSQRDESESERAGERLGTRYDLYDMRITSTLHRSGETTLEERWRFCIRTTHGEDAVNIDSDNAGSSSEPAHTPSQNEPSFLRDRQ